MGNRFIATEIVKPNGRAFRRGETMGTVVPFMLAGANGPEQVETDLKAIVQPLEMFIRGIGAVTANPYSRENVKMLTVGAGQLAMLPQTLRLPKPVHDVLRPVLAMLPHVAHASKQLITLRMQALRTMAKRPTIAVPINLALANGATTLPITIQNPYAGSTNGTAGDINGVWSITAVETGSLSQSGMLGLRFTLWNLGGHDAIGASQQGVFYTAGDTNVAAASARGWAFENFASDRRIRDETHIAPWNVMGEEGLHGSIMTENGRFVIAVTNASGSTYNGTIMAFLRASLCGLPWSDGAHDAIRKSFAPMRDSAELAHHMAASMPSKYNQLFGDMTHLRGVVEQLGPAMESITLPSGEDPGGEWSASF